MRTPGLAVGAGFVAAGAAHAGMVCDITASERAKIQVRALEHLARKQFEVVENGVFTYQVRVKGSPCNAYRPVDPSSHHR
jgi:hypothetical protein